MRDDRRRLLLLKIATAVKAAWHTVTGTPPLTLSNAVEEDILRLIQKGKIMFRNKEYLDTITQEGKCELRSDLPSGYEYVECVVGDVDAYTDLDTTLVVGDVIEIEFALGDTEDYGPIGIFGYYDDETPDNSLYIYTQGDSVYLKYPWVQEIVASGLEAEVKYKAVISVDYRAILDENGTPLAEDTASPLSEVDIPETGLGKILGDEGGIFDFFNGYLYSCVINGQRNLIPIANTTEYYGAFYDKISKRVFASEDAPFGYDGTVETKPSPDNPVDIVCNNGKLVARHQSGLPTGYQLYEYIEANNGPFITTSIKLASTDVVEAEFANISAAEYGGLYGVYEMGNSSAFYANQTYYGYDGVNSKVNTGVAVDTEWHTVVHDFVNGKLTLDGADTSFTPFEFANAQATALFARYYGSSYGYFFRGKARKFKVTRNGVVICNLLPVKRLSDDTFGFYDLSADAFYTNDGTGNFTAGSPVTDPIEIYADGTPETLTVSASGAADQTASVANLLSVGSRADSQEIIGGVVTRKCRVVVFDGTEPWQYSTSKAYWRMTHNNTPSSAAPFCTHYVGVNTSWASLQAGECFFERTSNQYGFIEIGIGDMSLGAFQSFLSEQYAAGTPVVIVIPAEETTEQTTPHNIDRNLPKTITYTAEVSNIVITQGTSTHTVPAPYAPLEMVCNNGAIGSQSGAVVVTGTDEVITVTAEETSNTQTASVEDLFAVGSFKDSHDVISGLVSRNVALTALTGLGNWVSAGEGIFALGLTDSYYPAERIALPCTHFAGTTEANADMPDNTIKLGAVDGNTSYGFVFIKATNYSTVADFTAFLAARYAANNPVIFAYPLAETVETSVTAQPLSTEEGTNTVSVSANVTNIELICEFKQTAA